MKKLKSIETEQYMLEVYECDCGFHVGFDATYLDQMGEVCVVCPNCCENICTSEEMEEE